MIPDFAQHPEAVAELEHAVDGFLSYSTVSAERFLNRVRRLLEELHRWPRSGKVYEDRDGEPEVRRYGVPGYEFVVYYFLRNDQPAIIAYAHEAQMPGYWKHRVDDGRV